MVWNLPLKMPITYVKAAMYLAISLSTWQPFFWTFAVVLLNTGIKTQSSTGLNRKQTFAIYKNNISANYVTPVKRFHFPKHK
ncbi:hypothetical protein [Mesobacillus zeae]|uniref:Uncharacterized protein n=1 Tax=Mesobacillus zeae TaxID=1917180 RepID=A0A398B800_9BACI|nr:hypothetical protein [Mesobacillus zeae]RID83843.1 hypothetical protein D1970_14655 [Mesobacillus zeae]